MKYDLILLLSLCALLAVRALIALYLNYSVLSKSKRKKYKKETIFPDRWFFWSAPQRVKDVYSKYEGKVIPYQAVMRFFRALNIAMHTLLVLEVGAAIIYLFDLIPHRAMDIICIIYMISFLGALGVIAGTFLITEPKHHHQRYRKK